MDSIVAGCIPVVFERCALLDQYHWHLPRGRGSYFVYIPVQALRVSTPSMPGCKVMRQGLRS